LKPGKYSQTSTASDPSGEKLNYTRRDRVKGVLVNTPTLAWAYTGTFKERGRRDLQLERHLKFLQSNGILLI
jgi:hypothetical protein